MSKLQLKYFGKKHKRVSRRSSALKVVHMARRRSFKRSSYSRGGGGGMKSMLAPVAGGFADNIIDKFSPIDGIGGVIVGMFLKSNTTRDIGLYKVGYSAANMIPIPGLTGGGFNSGGFQ